MIPKVKKWLFAGLLCLMLLPAGCRPEGIIPPAGMEDLFAEFYLADACIETMNSSVHDGLFYPDSIRIYQPIIEKQGYSEDAFRESLDYYLHRPSEMVKIFKHVHARLELDADRPVEKIDTEDVEEEDAPEQAEEEIATEKKTVKEGIEPDIEREHGDLPAVKPAQEKPQKEDKPAPKPANKRKRMTKSDLKRLEEELK